MIERLLRHLTSAEIDRNYTDTTALRSCASPSRTCSASGCCLA